MVISLAMIETVIYALRQRRPSSDPHQKHRCPESRIPVHRVRDFGSRRQVVRMGISFEDTYIEISYRNGSELSLGSSTALCSPLRGFLDVQ